MKREAQADVGFSHNEMKWWRKKLKEMNAVTGAKWYYENKNKCFDPDPLTYNVIQSPFAGDALSLWTLTGETNVIPSEDIT